MRIHEDAELREVLLLIADELGAIRRELFANRRELRKLTRGEFAMTATLTDVDAKIDALDNDLTSLSGGLFGLAGELQTQHEELLAALEANDPAAVDAVAVKLDATRAKVGDMANAVQAAIDENPDPASAPAPAPVEDPGQSPIVNENPPAQETIPSTPDGSPPQPTESGEQPTATGITSQQPGNPNGGVQV